MSDCVICGISLVRHQKKYCSNHCQAEEEYRRYIADWKRGKRSGIRGVHAKNISGHVIRYLRGKFGEKCSLCGWCKKNPKTDKVPLEIDHIDGDSENNGEENLRLICPNCHALSPNFRNLNRGRGRSWRARKCLKSPVHAYPESMIQ